MALRPARAVTIFCLGAALAGGSALARDRDPAPRVVEELAYGEVLFHFFQEDYLTALTRLLAAQARGELQTHAADGELLLGGLYLSYGQHRLAGEIFERVLAQSAAPATHDRAWFFLAKIWQQRGYLNEAEGALARIAGTLPQELEPERRMLEAQVLMELGRFDEALALLAAWQRPSDDWVGYAKYNIGVALVRLGRVAEGARVLEEVGQLAPKNAALAPLRDKANVALGYAWLQAEQPLVAKPALQRVRLEGPFSNKALLGAGWAEAEAQNYRAALAPWLELRGRSLLDSAVLESFLAIPYAFAELGADVQAADHYSEAIVAFDAEIARLDASIEAIERGELLDELLADDRDASGWRWRLARVPDTVEGRYLYELLATHRFQEGLKNYRDLGYLQRNLERWTESLGAFDDILDTRERAYRQRLPAIEAGVGGVDLGQLAAARVELQSRLAAIERTENFVALATPSEQRNWRELEALELKLERLGGDPQAEALRAKQHFLKGLLAWDLRRDYGARLWAAKSGVKDLERGLREVERRHQQVIAVREEWPAQFAGLTARIGELRPRVLGLEREVQASLAQQEGYLRAVAVAELDAQRERLASYRLQARFALASIYDRAAATREPMTDSTLLAERGR